MNVCVKNIQNQSVKISYVCHASAWLTKLHCILWEKIRIQPEKYRKPKNRERAGV